MTEFIAKPVVDNQTWIITDGTKKIGNIHANNSGYGVQIHGTFLQFNDTDELKRNTKIRFESAINPVNTQTKPYPEYPTHDNIYNSMLDVKRGLHLYTPTQKSKCYHAAGYFVITQGESSHVVFCPKYIFLQRYPYTGPFKSQEEAKASLATV